MIIKLEKESPAEVHKVNHEVTDKTRTQVVLEFGLFVRINLIAKRPCYPVTCQRTFRKSEGTRLMSNGSNRFTEPMRTRQASMADGEVLRKLESNSLRVSELRAEILKRNGRTRDDANRALRKEELINELRSLLQVGSSRGSGSSQGSSSGASRTAPQTIERVDSPDQASEIAELKRQMAELQEQRQIEQRQMAELREQLSNANNAQGKYSDGSRSSAQSDEGELSDSDRSEVTSTRSSVDEEDAVRMLGRGKSRAFLSEKEGKKWLKKLKARVNASCEQIVSLPMVKRLANWDLRIIFDSWFLTQKKQDEYFDRLDSKTERKQREEDKIFEALAREKLSKDRTFDKMSEAHDGIPEMQKWLREVENFGIPLAY